MLGLICNFGKELDQNAVKLSRNKPVKALPGTGTTNSKSTIRVSGSEYWIGQALRVTSTGYWKNPPLKRVLKRNQLHF